MVISALSPHDLIVSAKDVARSYESNQTSNALTQAVIAGYGLNELPNFPTENGTENAVLICATGMFRDVNCVNLDVLVSEGFIASIPQDSVEPCFQYSGYQVFLDNDQPFIQSVHDGKISGDDLVSHCKLDSLAPEITDVNSSLFAATANITWFTDEGSDAQVEYGVEGMGYTDKTAPPIPFSSTATYHSVILEGLKSYTTYHYRVYSGDGSGNKNISDDNTFTTGDTLPPEYIGFPNIQLTQSSATVAWETDESSTSKILYGETSGSLTSNLYDSTLVAKDGNNKYMHTFKIEDLFPDTRYYFRLQSIDSSFNDAGTYSPEYSFRTLPDITPPVISDIDASIAGTTLTVTWNTNESSTTDVDYGLDTDYGSTISGDSGLTHEVEITGLAMNQTYYFVLKSMDIAGNEKISDVQNKTVPDSIAPVITVGPVASPVTYNSATVTWTTDEPSISWIDYGVDTRYQSGSVTNINASTNHSLNLAALRFNTPFLYRIRLRDAAGNSATGSNFTFKTDHNIYNVSVPTALRSHSGATFTWDTRTAADSQVYFSANPSMSPLLAGCETAKLTTLQTTGHMRWKQSTSCFSPDTTYFYRIQSADSTNQMDTLSGSFLTKPDTTPPIISAISCILGCANGNYNSGTTVMKIQWTTDEPSNSLLKKGNNSALTTFPVTVTDGTMVSPTHQLNFPTGLPAATYYYKVQSDDAATNSSGLKPATANQLIIDTTLPTTPNVPSKSNDQGISMTLGATSVSENTKVIFYYSTSASCTVGVTASPCTASPLSASFVTSPSVGITGLTANTTYYYWMQLRDRAGNRKNYPTSGNYSTTTAADALGPTVTNITPTTNQNTLTPTITWQTNLNSDSQIRYSLNSNMSASTSVPSTGPTGSSTAHSVQIPTSLVPGSRYYFQVVSVKTSNGVSSGWVTPNPSFFYVDTTAPTLSGTPTVTRALQNGTGPNLTITISWNMSDAVCCSPGNAQPKIKHGPTNTYGNNPSAGALSGNSQTYVLNNLAQNTTATSPYHFAVQSIDQAGNASAWSSDRTFWNDLTAPTITVSPTEINVTDTDATIQWTTNEAGTGRVLYGPTTSYGSMSGTIVSAAAHTIHLKGLTPNTTYYYVVLSSDPAKNQSISSPNNFTTTDHVPPSISIVEATVTSDTDATITWDTNEPSNSRVEYSLNPSFSPSSFSSLDGTNVSSHSVDLIGLTQATQYYYRVRSCDAAGNCSTSTPDKTFTTTNTNPPVFSSILASGITDHSATISWTTNHVSDTQVFYSTLADFSTYQSTTLNTSLTTSHSQTLDSLTGETPYYFRVASRDAAGNYAIDTNKSFSTLGDVTPPVISAISHAVDGPALSATITWTTNETATGALDMGATTAYGTTTQHNTLTTSHSFTVTGLSANQLYHYRVRSSDTSGNETREYDFTFTINDSTNPVATSGPTPVNVTATSVNILWTTDEPAHTQVDYASNAYYTSHGNTYENQVVDGTLSLDHVANLTQNVGAVGQNILYNYRVKTHDSSNNTTTVLGTFTTDGISPVVTVAPAYSNLTSSSVRITWTTNEPSTTQVDYGPTGNNLTTVINPTLVTDHIIDIVGLSSNQGYRFFPISIDSAQNRTDATAILLTTP